MEVRCRRARWGVYDPVNSECKSPCELEWTPKWRKNETGDYIRRYIYRLYSYWYYVRRRKHLSRERIATFVSTSVPGVAYVVVYWRIRALYILPLACGLY